MSNVIREDVIAVGFDIDFKEFKKLQEDVDALKKSLLGDMGGDAFDDLKKQSKGASDGMDKAKQSAKKLGDGLTNLGKKAATTAYNGLKKIAGISFKALLGGVGAMTAAVGKIAYESVQAYAEFEQLKGGVETLFGAKGAKSIEEYAKIAGKSVDAVKGEYKSMLEAQSIVLKDANDAYKTTGLSANAYMETVTSFSASLISSLDGDTKKAASYANTALINMSDNANKMGTDMGSLQYAYQGFAKQNYTMLDNLKLGYGGTKTEMERLIKDAAKMKDVQAKLGVTVDENSMSFGNIVQAINVMQESMYINGTTAKEAEGTITGSLNAMKASWGNLLTAMASGENLDQCMDNMVSSVEIFGANVIPVAEKALMGLGTLVEKLAPIIADRLPDLAKKLLPPLISAAVSLVKGLVKALPDIIKTVGSTIVDILGDQFPILAKFGEFFEKNGDKIAKFIPILLGLVGAFKAFSAIKSITSIFGGGKSKEGETGGLTKTFGELAKAKPATILKGMANLALILGGFTVLTAAFMAVAPALANMADGKALLEVIAIIAVLGAVSAGLTKLADIAGKIPVMTVVKGLANMAIIVAGMSALFLLVGATSLLNFDYKRVLALVGIIGVLGTVGAALTVFAGIAGIIPIPIVLAGLANIALVLGGLTALVIAFGALSKVEGINEFITTGGELLANLFNVLGKVAGSLIGGIGEGITNSLPKIGENLSAFGKSLKPLFTSFSGVDMSGVSAFFGAIGGFMLQMAGSKALEFFAGSPDFAGVAEGLGTFAQSDGVKKFFTMVNGIEREAFEKGKLFFECMDGISNLPNTGGLANLFGGKNDFSGVASGLGQLSGENVKKFFAMVSSMEAVAFDNAKLFFECMDEVKNLPNVGGLGNLFGGENDFSGVATGLGQLASEGVKKFFTMVQKFDEGVFAKVTALFKSLSNISKLPNEGGFWQNLGDAITGKETKSALSVIADDLGNFASKTGSFFNQVNGLNLGNLNGLWKSLANAGKLTTANLGKVVDDSISTIVKKISELPQKMGNALKNNSKNLSNGFVDMWKEAVKASIAPVNKLLDGANHILKEFGSKKKVIAWTPYARGTGGHKGGNALVNDGRGAELVQMPNGHTFIPNGRNVFLPNAPRGMKVLPAEQTARLMGKKSPTFRYANGIGALDIWSYYGNAKGLVEKISESISYKGMSGFASNVGKSIVSTFAGEMPQWIDKLFEQSGQSIGSYVASKGVTQWLPTVIRALKMEGQYSVANVARTLFQMKTESGGNPRAINLWDSNAKKGIPSKGLMQVIDPTFRAYARDGFDKDIYDPLSNVLASVRYATSRYGSLSRAYRGVGYSKGVGTVTLPKSSNTVNLSYSPESDGGYRATSYIEYNTYSPQITISVSGSDNDRNLVRKIKRVVQQAIEDVIDEAERNNPKVREV